MCLSISMYEYPGDKGAAAAASVAMEKKWSPPPRKRGNGVGGSPFQSTVVQGAKEARKGLV